ncbi:iron-sulfur cluster assembly protein [Nitrosomonas sp. PY1]|uniref:HesB/IscA family protein n=1 Tax=Nitrosomonas sp. PY1 TaxID=1803906 RepID=UPI001FC8308E|nr:iron-sulfur cluster assembly accessory protein [Nitrosomonas sp. PY1]GKS68662.1 iron-sulfur cluster assembly protein [Nitrosomonas sp. PY1]
MSITLTENAGKYIQQQLAKMKPGTMLRIGVKKSGCSGNSYIVDYTEDIQSNDQIFESQNVKVAIASDILSFLVGSEVDLVKDGLNNTLKINNPNADSTCGCGDSFSVKEKAIEHN